MHKMIYDTLNHVLKKVKYSALTLCKEVNTKWLIWQQRLVLKCPISNTVPFKSFSSIYTHTNVRTTERHWIRRKLKHLI